MPGVFRRRWFPRLRKTAGPGRIDATLALTGVSSTAQAGSLSQNIDSNRLLTGVTATTQVGTPHVSTAFTLTGVEAQAQVGAGQGVPTVSLVGVEATTGVGGTTDFLIDSNRLLTGVSAPATAGALTGDHPTIAPIGVQAVAQVGAPAGNHPFYTLIGQQATAQISTVEVIANRSVMLAGVRAITQIPSSPFFLSPNIALRGVFADSFPTSHESLFPAGGGGGGAAGLFGNGEDGQDGLSDGTGGYGGAADNFNVPRQLIPSADGNAGTEFNGTLGTGSGGAGGSWGAVPYMGGFVGGDGGNGGLYGGGGAGGGGGPNGGGLGGQGADGIVYIWYQGSSGPVEIILDKTAVSPFIIPSDWSFTNKILLVGPGGCGSDGSFWFAGDGGFGGDTVGVENTLIFSPGDIIEFSIPATPCLEAPVRFGNYSAAAGSNSSQIPGPGDGAANGSATFPGGFITKGGIGGPGGRLRTLHLASLPGLDGLEVTAEVGSFSGGSGFPDDRVFVVAGRNQQVLPPGVAMYPTSQVVNFGSNPYIIASSQFYTIGQVSWDSAIRTQGVDWQFVDPFTHIIEILTPPTVGTPIQLVFFRWDIGVTAGFEVTSYPVPFSFLNTTIIAEDVPPVGAFFTVDFVRDRPMANPTTFFALYPLIVDDAWEFHAQYDPPFGFQTYRPIGYRVLDLAESQIFEWDGSDWLPSAAVPSGTKLYVKALRGIYVVIGSAILPVFQAGDPSNPTYPQALTYPNYGEGIGKNLLVDAFSPNAAVDYPAAYQVALAPGDFDPWVNDE